MRDQATRLRKGRPLRGFDTPARKVREAAAELVRLTEADTRDTECFRQALSAFLASSRAAQKVLARYSKERYATWEGRLSPDDAWLIALLLDARNLETYQDGPAIGIIVYGGAVPSGSWTHHYHAMGANGLERMLPIVDLCTRQMQLLDEGLKAVEHENQQGAEQGNASDQAGL